MKTQIMSKFFTPPTPKEIYKDYERGHTRLDYQMDEAKKSIHVSKIDYGCGYGISLCVDGANYPKKGIPVSEALWSANQAKVLFISFVSIFSSPLFIIPFILSYKKILTYYNVIALKAVAPFLLKDEYMTPIGYEIKKILIPFDSTFADIFSFIIDIDSAYRYRLEDLLSETTKELLLKQPRKEIKRLIKLNAEREPKHVGLKLKMVANFILVFLLIPAFKNKFKQVIATCEFKNLQFDQADYYWAMMNKDYNYTGRSYEERQEILRHYQKPIEYDV